ncbi:cell division/cell wall cluster transcriptional repressor MraZ [Boudabousia liubingyangii]|uniref:Transcriptional regulator MraZ n=1 Tax=Boudabousia liubingyangii TaxID=1921764 RepID=A0A1Q5PNU8_9ACTO|nr:division/cell wall cluster transcriptional repressor MraZ [Boudabousia liubingyangii]OKL47796.1 cell division/cell wall cluster transcriptional repressor MraZ [Boudabousia liubingyangii]OKL49179.1 cell division/cell wall cluster transcriptional repressor MraZ [Boudabousia liubingyangii]
MLKGFHGTYEPKLDGKGRLILPAKLREQLGNQIVLTRGQEHCLYVFPEPEFARMYEELSKASLTSKQARLFTRFLLSGADDQELDKQGRVSIAQPLRDYAHLERDLVVIGSGRRVEIWDAATWQAYLDEGEDEFANMAEEIVPGLF